MAASVDEARNEWYAEIFGSINIDAMRSVFTEETQSVADYTDEDLELLKEWAAVWKSLKDKNVDPTAAIKASGYAAIGKTAYDEIWNYFTAAWRMQHTHCPGNITQWTYFSTMGLPADDHYIGDIIGDSVSDVMEALICSTIADQVTEWVDYEGDAEGNPYEAGITLVKHNLVPYTNGTDWFLCSGKNTNIIYRISEEDLFAE